MTLDTSTTIRNLFDLPAHQLADNLAQALRRVGALEAEKTRLSELLAMADGFTIGKHEGNTIRLIKRAGGLWSIADGAYLLPREGDWEVDQRSSGTPEHRARTRFPFEEALARAKALCEGGAK